MDKYLKGIKDSDATILKEIYDNNFETIKSFILKNKGNNEDAKDVFQEAMISTYRRLQRNDFELTSTFQTYIFNVGKYIWFKKLKINAKTVLVDDFKEGEAIDLVKKDEMKYSLFRKGLSKLGEDCKKVLSYYFERKNFKEIASLMSYTGADYARRKKYLCTKELVKIVKADPLFLEL